MQQLDIATGVVWYVVFVYSTVCHEAAHAWTSYKLGDRTAYDGGQVSLDPTPHIRREPIGMVAVPIINYLLNGSMLGWAHAPYDPEWARRYPVRAAWMAMAGPLANLLLFLLASILMIVGVKTGVLAPLGIAPSHLVGSATSSAWDACGEVLSVVWSLNLTLFVLNMLPLPPLDGSNIPLFFLNGRARDSYQEMIKQPAMAMFGILVAFRGFQYVAAPVYAQCAVWLYRLM